MAAPTPTGLKSKFIRATKVGMGWDFTVGATKYELERATVTGGPYTSLSATITDTSFIDTTALANTKYFYRVSAFDTVGQGSFSAEVEIATAEANEPILDRAESDIIELIPDMTIANGFNFDWSDRVNIADIAKNDVFPALVKFEWDPEEINNDDEEGVDAQTYINEVEFMMECVGKLSTNPTNPRNAIRSTLNKMRDDIVALFGQNHSLKEFSGILTIMYSRARRITPGSGDIKKSMRLQVWFTLRYMQDRLNPLLVAC